MLRDYSSRFVRKRVKTQENGQKREKAHYKDPRPRNISFHEEEMKPFPVLSPLIENILKTMNKKNKSLSSDAPVRKIGGRIYSIYCKLNREINNVDSCAFAIWEPFQFLDIDISTYISIAKNGEGKLLPLLKTYRYNEYLRVMKEGNPSEVKKYKTYPTEEKAKRGILRKASFELNQTLGTQLRFNRLYNPHTWNERIIRYFEDCLFLDPEDGLHINTKKFIAKYNDLTKAQQSKRYERHVQLTEAINSFFAGIPITWEELQRFFVISNGQIEINPSTQSTKLYLRLEG